MANFFNAVIFEEKLKAPEINETEAIKYFQ
jgi:hypothetical protein